MSDTIIQDMLRHALWIAVQISAPLLIMALIAGLAIGLLQALTSVQEATLTFVPKIGAMMVVFWATMGFMTARLIDFFQRVVIPALAGG
jgi:flagellar biosynthesis protein FliQ